jgi:hypothetical protein
MQQLILLHDGEFKSPDVSQVTPSPETSKSPFEPRFEMHSTQFSVHQVERI